MELYEVLLFVHVLGAIVVVGGALAAPVVLARLRGARDAASLRALASLHLGIARSGNWGAVLILVAGVWMTLLAWGFGTSWIDVSLLAFVLIGALQGAVVERHAKRLVAAVDADAAGPVPADAAAMAAEPAVHRATALALALSVAIVFLMTVKPGYAGAVVVLVGALVAGGVASARVRPGVQPAAP